MTSVRMSSCSLLVLVLVFTMQSTACSATDPAEPSLDPSYWPEGELTRFVGMGLDAYAYQRDKPLGISHGKGLVTGTTSPLAIHSGLHALRVGGNAMDACIATATAQVAMVAGAYVSYMGATNIVYYEKSSGKVYNIDGGWYTPKNGNFSNIPPPDTAGPNGASVLVPGFIAGVADAAEKFAKFPLSTLLEPAIFFADKGFLVTYGLAGMINAAWNNKVLNRTDEGRKIFTNPATKKPYQFGEHFAQPEMASFLKNVAKYGKDYVYKGAFASELVNLTKAQGGYLTMEDMENYQVSINETKNTTYKGHLIATTAKDWGGVELIEKMNLFELAGIGNDSYLTNETQLFWMASIIRWSWFVSTYTHSMLNGRVLLKQYFWGLDFTNENRQTKEFARAIWDHMILPNGMTEINKKIKFLLGGQEEDLGVGYHSDGLIAADSEGNVCSMIHTINSLPWGTGLFVQGNALSNSGSVFRSYLRTTPHAAPLPSAIQPAIIFKPLQQARDQQCAKEREDSTCKKEKAFPWRPAYAVSVVGGSHPQVAPQFISNLVDLGYNPNQALRAPNLLRSSAQSFQQDLQYSYYAFDNNLVQRVSDMGQYLRGTEWSNYKAIAGLGVALSITEDGTMYGASSPFMNGLPDTL